MLSQFFPRLVAVRECGFPWVCFPTLCKFACTSSDNLACVTHLPDSRKPVYDYHRHNSYKMRAGKITGAGQFGWRKLAAFFSQAQSSRSSSCFFAWRENIQRRHKHTINIQTAGEFVQTVVNPRMLKVSKRWPHVFQRNGASVHVCRSVY